MRGLPGRLVRIAARSLPAAVRDRYREEWLADLAGADEAGVSRADIVIGALTTAATISRTAPEVTGLTLDRLFAHRLRVAASLLGGAAVLATGYYAYGGYVLPSGPGSALLGVAGSLALAVAAALGVAGLVMLGHAVSAAVASRRFGLVIVLVAAPVVLAAVLVAAPYLLLGVGALTGPLALVALAGLVVAFSAGRDIHPARYRLLLAGGFALAAGTACAVGILHIAVWNPLARVPGLTLDEIYAGLDAAGEAAGLRAWLIAWAVIVGLASIAFVGAALVWRAATTRRLVATGFLLLAGTTAIGLIPGFSMGMGLADTFMTTGGDAAPAGPMLAIFGQTSLVAAILAAFVRPPAPRRERLAVVQP